MLKLLREGAEALNARVCAIESPVPLPGALASSLLPWWEKCRCRYVLRQPNDARGAPLARASRDLWSEPSLDDPCGALCVVDRAPKPRAVDGKLSEVS